VCEVRIEPSLKKAAAQPFQMSDRIIKQNMRRCKMKKIKLVFAFCSVLLLFTGQLQAGKALFGEWMFNNGAGTIAQDTSSYGNNANLAGVAGWGSDYFSFNGSNYFTVSHTPSLFKIDMSKSFEISMSFRTTQMSTGTLMSRHNGTWLPGCKELYVNGGYLNFGCGWVGTVFGSTFVSDGYWHDLSVIFDAGTGAFTTYVDGYSDGSGNLAAIVSFPDDYDIYIGVHTAYANFVGDIKNVRIYQFPTKAYNPNPSNGNVGVSTAITQVSWLTPDANYTYDVYFSTVQQDVNSNATSAKIGNHQSVLTAAVTLAIGQTYYWKVNCIKPDTTVIPGDIWTFTTVSYKAYSPNPTSEATGVSIFKQLGWTAGLNATSHKVYFSDKFADVDNGTVTPATVTTTSYNPGTLKLDTTYFWRVDEVASSTTRGDLWSFTTSDVEILDNFQYVTNDLRTVWVGPGTNEMSPFYNHIWMKIPYSTTDQTFTRTFANAIDLSKGAILAMDYRHDVAGGLPAVALVTVSLLDAGNNVLLSSQLSDPVVNWPTNDYGLYVANWNIPIWTQRATLTAVKKISIKVSGVASPGSTDAFFVDNLRIAGPACTTAIPGDLDNDCQVSFSDFAVMAQNWMQCNRMPLDTCWNF